MSTYSGLSASNAATARRIIVAAVEVCMANAGSLHYSEGGNRWSGVDHRIVAASVSHNRAGSGGYTVYKTGHRLDYGDCSSTGTWLMWQALYLPFRLPDRVNGLGWGKGYTGTLIRHGRRVSDVSDVKVGDAIIYGSGPDGDHVSWSLGGTRAFSHGSEAGPFIIDATSYRASEILGIRRYI